MDSSLTSATGPTLARPGAEAVEAAARTVLQAMVAGDSAFTPGVAVWTPEHADELIEHFVRAGDVSGSSFDDKLAKQLAGCSDGAIWLFGEIYYLDLLPLADYKGSTKRACLRTALGLASEPVSIPAALDAAFDGGVFGGGVAFKTRRFWQLSYLIEAFRGLLDLPREERARLLTEPLEFRDRLAIFTTVNAPSQKYGLLYLAFPDFYLPIIKTEHRVLIRQEFLDRVGATSTGDPDDDLRLIYAALTHENGRPVDLYQAPFRELWDPKADSSTTYRGRLAPWPQFMYWAARVAASIDLRAEERDYKVTMAERLESARPLVEAGAPGWREAFTRALNYGNLLSQHYKIALFDVLKHRPDEARALVTAFWSQPDPALLDTFHADLKSVGNRAAFTPGNDTSLGSVLMMSRDLTQFPPYRPTPVTKAADLVGLGKVGTSPNERYETLLALCDEVLDRAGEEGIELEDRLDAQGVIWAVVNHDPADWSEHDAAAFLAWRGEIIDGGTSPAQRAWLVRGNNVNGTNLVPTWVAEGYCSIPLQPGVSLTLPLDRDQIEAMVERDYAQKSYVARADKVEEIDTFLNRIQADEIVVTTTGDGSLHLGRIVGEPGFVADAPLSALRRRVTWVNPEAPLPFGELSRSLATRLKSQHTVVDLTSERDALEALIGTPIPPSAPTELTLPRATEELAEQLLVSTAWLQECLDLLAEKRQLIFYGPPGTGKTFLAQALARHMTAAENVKLVQFHPSYSYEDFFEGYRPVKPVEGSTTVGFTLTPGPFRRLVDRARDSESTAYVLIIDEINRANLAKVFGELYFLLEYRDEAVDLLYASGDQDGFTLPENVFIIGTMNTADRSIALVDTAMRRRFAFVRLDPSVEPTRGMLGRWLSRRHLPDEVARLLAELNARIDDPDFKIGPSYLMSDTAQTTVGLDRIWRTSILPLLEEHHFGEGIDVEKKYGLDAIRASVTPPADPPDPPVAEPTAEPVEAP